MPYDSNKSLPERVKSNLPDHAQDIYRGAYNSAWKEYDDEETAHKVAWSAVKNKYEKHGDDWKKKSD